MKLNQSYNSIKNFRNLNKKTLFVILFIFLSINAFAATYTWTGGGDGTSWTDVDNWNSSIVPTSADTAIFNTSGTYNISLSSDVTITRIEISDSAKLTINGPGALECTSGNITRDIWGSDSSTFTVNTEFTVTGTFQLERLSTLTVNNGYTATISELKLANTTTNSNIVVNGELNVTTLNSEDDLSVATVSSTGSITATTISNLSALNNNGTVSSTTIDNIDTITNEGTIATDTLTNSGTPTGSGVTAVTYNTVAKVYTWTGGAGSNAWATAGNWDNGIPDIDGSEEVLINLHANINATTNLAFNTAGNNKIIINLNGYKLSCSGNFALGSASHPGNVEVNGSGTIETDIFDSDNSNGHKLYLNSACKFYITTTMYSDTSEVEIISDGSCELYLPASGENVNWGNSGMTYTNVTPKPYGTPSIYTMAVADNGISGTGINTTLTRAGDGTENIEFIFSVEIVNDDLTNTENYTLTKTSANTTLTALDGSAFVMGNGANGKVTLNYNTYPQSAVVNLKSDVTPDVGDGIVITVRTPDNALDLGEIRFIQGELLWTGATNSNWATATNWSTGTVPAITDKITVPSSCTNWPDITSNVSIKKISIKNNAHMNISSGTLSVEELELEGTSFIQSTSGTVLFTGTNASWKALYPEASSFYNVSIDSTTTFTPASDLYISGTLDNTSGGTYDAETNNINTVFVPGTGNTANVKSNTSDSTYLLTKFAKLSCTSQGGASINFTGYASVSTLTLTGSASGNLLSVTGDGSSYIKLPSSQLLGRFLNVYSGNAPFITDGTDVGAVTYTVYSSTGPATWPVNTAWGWLLGDANDYIWLGRTSSWNSVINWNTGSVPIPGKNVIIPGSGVSVYPKLNSVISLGTGTITIEESGSLDCAGYNITCASIINNGTIKLKGNETLTATHTNGTSGNSNVTYYGGAVASLNWGASYENITIDSTVSSCNVGTITVTHAFKNSGAISLSSSLTLTSTLTNNGTIAVGANTLSFGTYSGTDDNVTIADAGKIIATGTGGTIATLTPDTDASFTIDGGTSGIVVTNAIAPASGTCTLTTTGKISLQGTSFVDVTVSSGTLTASGNITASGLVTNSGTIAVGAKAISFGTYSGSGSIGIASGKITATGTGGTIKTLTPDASASFTIDGGSGTNGIVVTNAITPASGTCTLTTKGKTSLNGTKFVAVTVDSGTLTASGDITATSITNNGTIAVGAKAISFGTYSGTSDKITIADLGTITATGTGGTITTLTPDTDASFTIDGGTSGIVVTNAIAPASGTCTLTTKGKTSLQGTKFVAVTNSGTLTASGNITASGLVTNSGTIAVGAQELSFGSYSGTTGTVKIADLGKITATGTGGIIATLTPDASASFTIDGGSGTDGIVVTNAITPASGTCTLTTKGKTSLNGTSFASVTVGGTLTLNEALTSNSLTISTGASFVAGTNATDAYTISLSGNWNNSTTGTNGFTPQKSTVEFTDSATINGSNSFYNFKCIKPGKTLSFEKGKTQSIVSGGTFTITGATGNEVVLDSTDTATPTSWSINANPLDSTIAVNYAKINNSNSSYALVGLTGFDTWISDNQSKTTNWFFANYIWTGTTDSSWDTIANWTDSLDNAIASVPSKNNTQVSISIGKAGSPATNKLDLPSAVSLKSITVNSDSTLDLSTYNVTVSDTTTGFTNNGTVSLSGTQTISGKMFNGTDSTIKYYGDCSNLPWDINGATLGKTYENLIFDAGSKTTTTVAETVSVNETMTIDCGSTNDISLSSTSNVFTNPVVITSGGSITLSSDGNSTIADGAESDSVEINGNVKLAGNYTTTGTQKYNNNLTLTGNITLKTTNSAVTITGTVTGAFNLAFDTGTGTIGIYNQIGTDAARIGALTSSGSGSFTLGSALYAASVDIDGTVNINGETVKTTGTQKYDGNVTLGANVTLLSGTNTITFSGTVNSDATARKLTIGDGTDTNTSPVTFTGSVGDSSPLLEFVSGTGLVTINGGAVTTTGAQTYNGNVTLGADTTLIAGTNTIEFSGTVDSDTTARSITIGDASNASSVSFKNTVGSTQALATLLVYGSTVLGTDASSVFTTGNQTYTGTVTLGTNTILVANSTPSVTGGTAATVKLNSGIKTNGVTGSEKHYNLNIGNTTANSNFDFSGTFSVDSTNYLSNLNVYGTSTIYASAVVAVREVQTYYGSVVNNGTIKVGSDNMNSLDGNNKPSTTENIIFKSSYDGSSGTLDSTPTVASNYHCIKFDSGSAVEIKIGTYTHGKGIICFMGSGKKTFYPGSSNYYFIFNFVGQLDIASNLSQDTSVATSIPSVYVESGSVTVGTSSLVLGNLIVASSATFTQTGNNGSNTQSVVSITSGGANCVKFDSTNATGSLSLSGNITSGSPEYVSFGKKNVSFTASTGTEQTVTGLFYDLNISADDKIKNGNGIRVLKDLSIASGGTYNHNSKILTLGNNSTPSTDSVDGTITDSNTTLTNLGSVVIRGQSGQTKTASSNLQVSSLDVTACTLKMGTLATDAYTLNVSGNLTFTSGSGLFTSNASTIKFNGTTQSFSTDNQNFHNIEINADSSLTSASSFSCSGDWKNLNATAGFTATGTSKITFTKVGVSGNELNVSGNNTFIDTEFSGTSSIINISGTNTFSSIAFTGIGSTVKFAANKTQTVTSSLKSIGNSASKIVLTTNSGSPLLNDTSTWWKLNIPQALGQAITSSDFTYTNIEYCSSVNDISHDWGATVVENIEASTNNCFIRKLYWYGNTNTSWTEPSNWSTTEGTYTASSFYPGYKTSINEIKIVASTNVLKLDATDSDYKLKTLVVGVGQTIDLAGKNVNTTDTTTGFTNNGTVSLSGTQTISGKMFNGTNSTIKYYGNNCSNLPWDINGATSGKTYENLIFDTGSKTTTTVTETVSVNKTMTIDCGSTNNISLSSTSNVFTNPVVITSGGSITLSSNGNLMIASGAESDSVEINGNVKLAGNYTTTGTQKYNNDLTLTNDVTLLSGTNTITFTGTVNSDAIASPRNLTIGDGTNSSPVTFSSAVGASYPLASITTGTGNVKINGGLVATTGDQTYNGQVSSTGKIIIQSGGTVSQSASAKIVTNELLLKGSGTFNFGTVENEIGTIASSSGPSTDGAITIRNDATKTLTIGQIADTDATNINGITRSGSFSSTGDNTVVIQKDIDTSSGNGNFSIAKAVTLTGATTNETRTIKTGSGTVSFSSTLDSDSGNITGLQITSTGSQTFTGTIGNTTPLLSFDTGTGDVTINGGTVKTTTTQTYDGAVSLNAATTFTGTNISFNNTVDGNAKNLTITGNVVFGDGSTDTVTDITVISVSGTTSVYTNTITSSGTQTYTGAVTLHESPTFTGSTVYFVGGIVGSSKNITIAGNSEFGDGTNTVTCSGLGTLNVSGTSLVKANTSITSTGLQKYIGKLTNNGTINVPTNIATDVVALYVENDYSGSAGTIVGSTTYNPVLEFKGENVTFGTFTPKDDTVLFSGTAETTFVANGSNTFKGIRFENSLNVKVNSILNTNGNISVGTSMVSSKVDFTAFDFIQDSSSSFDVIKGSVDFGTNKIELGKLIVRANGTFTQTGNNDTKTNKVNSIDVETSGKAHWDKADNGGSLQIVGAITADGTLDYHHKVVTLNHTQAVAGIFYDLIIATSSNITNNGITVRRNLEIENGGAFTHNDKSLILGGTSGAVDGNIKDSNATLNNLGHVEISNSKKTTETNITFGQLTIASSGTLDFATNNSVVSITANGTSTGATENSGTIKCGTGNITFNGDYKNVGTGTLTANASGKLIFKNDVDLSSGTFTHSNGTIEISGSGTQTVTSGSTTKLYKIEINKNDSTEVKFDGTKLDIENTITSNAKSIKISFIPTTLNVTNEVSIASTGSVILGNGTSTLDFNGGFVHTVGSTTVSNNVNTSGDVFKVNTLVLGANSILKTVGGQIDINGTTNGTYSFEVDSGTGNINFKNNIGLVNPLTSIKLKTDAANSITFAKTDNTAVNVKTSGEQSISSGIINLSGTHTTSNSNVTFTGAVVLLQNTSINTGTGSGNITFTSTVDGSTASTKSLTLTSGTGNIYLQDNIGSSKALSSLTINNGTSSTIATPTNTAVNVTTSGEQSINSGIINLSGTHTTSNNNVTFTGTVVLLQNTSVDTGTGSGNITFTSTVDGNTASNQSLTLTSGTGNIYLRNNIGSSKALSSLTINSGNSSTIATPTNTAVNVTTSGEQSISSGTINLSGTHTTSNNSVTFTGTVVLLQNTSINTGTGIGNITFTGSVDGSTASTQSLTLTSGTGNIYLRNNVGISNPLYSLTINSGTSSTIATPTNTAVNVKTSGVQSITSSTINLSGTHTTSNNNVTFTGTVVLLQNTSINTGTGSGSITFTSTVDGNTPSTQNLTLTSGTGNITVSGIIGETVSTKDITVNGKDITLTGIGNTNTGAVTLNINSTKNVFFNGTHYKTSGTQTIKASKGQRYFANGSWSAGGTGITLDDTNLFLDHDTKTLTLASALKVKNLYFYRGSLDLGGQTITTTGDFVVFGTAYTEDDSRWSSADSRLSYYNTGLDYYCNGGTYSNGDFSTNTNATFSNLASSVINVGKNFYNNGSNMNSGAFTLNIPNNSSSKPTYNNTNVVTEKQWGSPYAVAFNMTVSNCTASNWVSSDTANSVTDGTGNTNWQFGRPQIASVETVYDNVIRITFNIPVENSDNEVLKIINSTTYGSKDVGGLWYHDGTKHYQNNTITNSVFTDPECTTALTNSTEPTVIYVQTENGNWNTDATGSSAGGTNSTDRSGVHCEIIPKLYMQLGSFYAANGKTMSSSYGTNGQPIYTGTTDECRPTLVELILGVETTSKTVISPNAYDGHNYVQLRYSEPVNIGGGPGLTIADCTGSNIQSSNLFTNATEWGGAISGKTITGYVSFENGDVVLGARNDTNPSTSDDGINSNNVNGLYRASPNTKGTYGLYISIAGWSFEYNSIRYWPGYFSSTPTALSGKVSSLANDYITDSNGNKIEASVANGYAKADVKFETSGAWDNDIPKISTSTTVVDGYYDVIPLATSYTIDSIELSFNKDIRDSSFYYKQGKTTDITGGLDGWLFKLQSGEARYGSIAFDTEVKSKAWGPNAIDIVDDNLINMSNVVANSPWNARVQLLFNYKYEDSYITDTRGNLLPSYIWKYCVEKQPPRVLFTSAEVGSNKLYLQFTEPVWHNNAGNSSINASDFILSSNSISGIENIGDYSNGVSEVFITMNDVITSKFALDGKIFMKETIVDKSDNAADPSSQFRAVSLATELVDVLGASDGVHIGDSSTTENALVSGALGLLRTFDGSTSLYDMDTTIFTSVDLSGSVSASTALSLYYDVNPSTDCAMTMSITGRNNSLGAFYLPTYVSGFNYQGNTDVRLLSPFYKSDDGILRNFLISSEDSEIASGNEVSFLMRFGDLWLARGTSPGDPRQFDLWRYKVQDIVKQRGGVTIMNNVINSDSGERTALQIDIVEAGQVSVLIFTLDGDVVTTLHRGRLAAGSYNMTWDGKNGRGRPVTRGMYFIRVVGPGIDEIRKVMVVRD